MNSSPNKLYAGREARQWWAISDNVVVQVTGYSCGPNQPSQWWCPTIGYTCTEGHSLFNTEHEALVHLERDLDERIDTLGRIVLRVRARRHQTS